MHKSQEWAKVSKVRLLELTLAAESLHHSLISSQGALRIGTNLSKVWAGEE